MTAGSGSGGLSRLAQEVLPVLYQHRLVSTSQLHRLLQPHVRTPVYLRRQLRLLREAGLAGAAMRRKAGERELLWYCPPVGAEVVEASGEVAVRAYRMSEQAAASPLQEHTLAVNEVGVRFVEAARAAGEDECGPLDWHQEQAHRIRDGERGRDAVLVPDAVLSYTHTQVDGQRMLMTFFVEVDRATESVAQLVAKVAAYSRYRRYVPAGSGGWGRARAGAVREAWRERYLAFPRLLVVFSGRSEEYLGRRIADLRGVLGATGGGGGEVLAGATTLSQLQVHGPFARIFTPLVGDDAAADVLLRAPSALSPVS